MPIPTELRDEYFREHFAADVQKYKIRQEHGSIDLDYRRVGYIMSLHVIKMYNGSLGQDAYVWFYFWAAENKLKCNKHEDELWKDGHLIMPPWTTSLKRIYDRFSFQKYGDIGTEVLWPPRDPIFKRTPVCSLKKC